MLAMADAFGLEVTGEAGILAAILEEYPAAIYRAAIVADAGLAIGNTAHDPTLLTPRGAAYRRYLGSYGIGTHGVGAQLGDVGCDAAILRLRQRTLAAAVDAVAVFLHPATHIGENIHRLLRNASVGIGAHVQQVVDALTTKADNAEAIVEVMEDGDALILLDILDSRKTIKAAAKARATALNAEAEEEPEETPDGEESEEAPEGEKVEEPEEEPEESAGEE